MTLSVIYLLVLVPAIALGLGFCALKSSQKSAAHIREMERQRSVV